MNQTEKEINYIDMVPSSWFKNKEGSSIWLTGYLVYAAKKEDFVSGSIKIDFDNIRVILLYGKLEYLDTGQFKIKNIVKPNGQIILPKIKMSHTPEGAYLLIFTPFDVDGQKGDETVIRQRIDEVVGLMAAFNGRNMVYERIFDNILKMSGGISSFSPVVDNPLYFVKPDISDSRFKAISRAGETISKLEISKKRRVQLSLRWFESAIYDSGVDGYIKYWIALETLGMPDGRNIRPLNEILSIIYKLSDLETQKRFAIGRLFGLRSNIVHNGQIRPIQAQLLKYIEALYIDILFEYLNLPTEKRAEKTLSEPEFEINKYI